MEGSADGHLPKAVQRTAHKMAVRSIVHIQKGLEMLSGKVRKGIRLVPSVHIIPCIHLLETAGKQHHFLRVSQKGYGAIGPHPAGRCSQRAQAGGIFHYTFDQADGLPGRGCRFFAGTEGQQGQGNPDNSFFSHNLQKYTIPPGVAIGFYNYCLYICKE